jgi:hypothetical protein
VHGRQTTREKVLGGFVSWLVDITLSLPCGEQTSKKPVEVGAVSQRLIPTGERSGLLMHIASP